LRLSNKSSFLSTALSVTKFITIVAINLVTLWGSALTLSIMDLIVTLGINGI